MDRIHTGRDRMFDERNIDLLREGALRFAQEYCGAARAERLT